MTSCTCRSCRKGKAAATTTTAARSPRRPAAAPTRIRRSAPAPATAAPAPTTASTVSRADVDQLAAALPADRAGWDGQPLSAKDRRFFALRDSGYTGPIDQDGYPDTTSDAAGILRRMAHDRGETTSW